MSGRGGGRGFGSRITSLRAFDANEPAGGEGGRYGGRGGGRGRGRYKKPLNANYMPRTDGAGGNEEDNSAKASSRITAPNNR